MLTPSTTITLTLALGTLLLGGPAQASPPEEPAFDLQEPIDLQVPAEVRLRAYSESELHDRLVLTVPEYRSAHRMQKAGAIVAAIGGSLGGTLLVLGGSWYSSNGPEPACSGEGCIGNLGWGLSRAFSEIMMVSGAIMAGASLLVGLPLYLAGKVKAGRLRREARDGWLPEASAIVLPRQAGLQLGWRF